MFCVCNQTTHFTKHSAISMATGHLLASFNNQTITQHPFDLLAIMSSSWFTIFPHGIHAIHLHCNRSIARTRHAACSASIHCNGSIARTAFTSHASSFVIAKQSTAKQAISTAGCHQHGQASHQHGGMPVARHHAIIIMAHRPFIHSSGQCLVP